MYKKDIRTNKWVQQDCRIKGDNRKSEIKKKKNVFRVVLKSMKQKRDTFDKSCVIVCKQKTRNIAKTKCRPK